MKKFFSIAFFLLSFPIFSQDITINIPIRDSISINNFKYACSGKAVLGDSLIFHVELIDDSDNSKLFTGICDMSNISNSTIPNFTYDQQTFEYKFDIGNYTKSNLFVHIWTSLGTVKKDELYYQQ